MTDPGDYITESYLRRQIEVNKAFPEVSTILLDLAFARWWSVHKAGIASKDWFTKSKLYQDSHPGTSEGKVEREYSTLLSYTITDRFYRPGGEVLRGDPQGVSQEPVTTGEYTSIHNGSQSDIVHEVNKSVTLEHSRSSTLSKGIQLDMTAKAEAGYGGVSASLETHLGVTVNSEESESSSTESSAGFDDTVTIKSGEDVAIVYSKSTKRYSQPFSINAIADVAFKVWFHGIVPQSGPKVHYLLSGRNEGLWDWKGHGEYSTHFDSLHDFCGFIRGYDPRAPEMRGYSGHMSPAAKAALAKLESDETLRLQLTGTQTVIQDGDADYSVRDIQNLSDEEVQHDFGRANQPLAEALANAPALAR